MMTQKLANHDLFDEREDEYFNERRSRFTQTLVNSGLSLSDVQQFLREKGSYTADTSVISHCVNMGKLYIKPTNFTPITPEPEQVFSK